MRRPLKLLTIFAAVLLSVAALAGCANDNLAKQYAEGSGKNYIAGSGVTEVKAADRGKPITFSGPTTEGTTFNSGKYRGDVLVVNFWYAGCPPCRAEAKDMQKLSQQFKGEGVQFIGVNTRDGIDTAQSFDTTFGVTYPSILDADSGSVQLAFSGSMIPNATPTTFVIDRTGRIAARIDGAIDVQPSTLQTLISDAVAEHSGA